MGKGVTGGLWYAIYFVNSDSAVTMPRSAHQVWSCKRSTNEIFRGVCSCRTVRPPESARLTAHDPVTGEQVRYSAL